MHLRLLCLSSELIRVQIINITVYVADTLASSASITPIENQFDSTFISHSTRTIERLLVVRHVAVCRKC